jgi:hypothetical protein
VKAHHTTGRAGLPQPATPEKVTARLKTGATDRPSAKSQKFIAKLIYLPVRYAYISQRFAH